MLKNYTALLTVFLFTVFCACCNNNNHASSHLPKTSCFSFFHNSTEIDSFINNPFKFTILKNYSDNFTSIGTILKSSSTCPLQKENIADPAFCFLRTIQYDGLRVNIFSFDVLQSGTAEYIITNSNIVLRNGIKTGDAITDITKKLGKPYRIKEDKYIWRSTDLHNYLAFTIENGKVVTIRWHEERQPEFKGKIVWETKYD